MMQVKKVDYQVPRLAFFWLLLAQTFLLLPHFFDFFVVLFPVWLICIIWRIRIYQSKAGYPNAIFKFFMVAIAIVAIRLFQARWLMLETAILMLILAFLLKLIEMRAKRDVLVVIYLAYFVLAAQLLMSQTIWEGLYLLMSLLLITTALVALHGCRNNANMLKPFKTSAILLAVSLPIMLIGFLVFPRLDPLWKVPMPNAAKTGVSGVMSPGLFSSLAQSDAVAFRVKFNGALPRLEQMYWRGLTLTAFDGVQWTPNDDSPIAFTNNIALSAVEQYRYDITMEPSQQSWLFLLENVLTINPSVLQKDNTSLQAYDAIDQRMMWQVTSAIQSLPATDLSPISKKESLQLPKGFNSKTLLFAKQMKSVSVNDEDYIRRVLDYYRQQPFFYSLNPPLLGKDTIDDFLFSSRKGFCEHYSASFVVLMRAVNIPARVVAGYQGGDVNPYEHHITVRQMDAHAWAEVWLKEKGWVRIDPTYAVAPERIEKGSQASLQQDESFLANNRLSPLRLRSISWLSKLQYRFDQVNFLWQTSVLQYNADTQKSVLVRLLGKVDILRVALLVLGGFMLLALGFALFTFLQYKPLSLPPAEKMYRRWLKKLAKQGIVKLPSEGALDFSARLKNEFPMAAVEIDDITHSYYTLHYVPNVQEIERVQLLKKMQQTIKKIVLTHQ